MNTFEYLVLDQPSRTTKSFSIGPLKIQAPSYLPEIKGEEDIEVLLRFSKALETNNPIIVPAYRWSSLISNPRFKYSDINRISISELIKNHPLIFYEPPEFFRYTLSTNLITYAFKGDRQKARKFNTYLKKGNTSAALDILPEFFRPFAEKQMKSIYIDKNVTAPSTVREKNDVKSGWFDDLVVNSYPSHMAEIISEAMKMPYSAVIPTVPPLMKNSERIIFERIFSTNGYTSLLCKKMSDEKQANPVRPYFHLYVDNSIFEGRDDQVFAYDILEKSLERYEYCGVALTLNGYESTASKGKFEKIEAFLENIVDISHNYKMPVLLPRSGWYGLSLTNQGIQGFSSLMNGKLQYMRGGGMKNDEDRYGKAALIDACVELNLPEVRSYIKKYGELPKVSNLPSKPDRGDITNPLKYRINFAKPLRLIHVEEARRIRKGQINEVRNPAKRYFERSQHPILKNN